jgi:hypothetical protein
LLIFSDVPHRITSIAVQAAHLAADLRVGPSQRGGSLIAVSNARIPQKFLS